jgi:hypothetical protein
MQKLHQHILNHQSIVQIWQLVSGYFFFYFVQKLIENFSIPGKPITTPIMSATTSRVISAAALNNTTSFNKYDEKVDNKRNETLERKKKDEKAKVKAEKEAKKVRLFSKNIRFH